MDFIKLVIIAMVLEALWENAKMLWQSGKANPDRIGATALGILLCIAAGIDFFEMAQIPLTIPYLGMALSGLLISRGANVLHDLLEAIGKLKLNKGA